MSKRRNTINEGIMTDLYSDAKQGIKDVIAGFKDFIKKLEKRDKKSADLLEKLINSVNLGEFKKYYTDFFKSYIEANKGYFDEESAKRYLVDNPAKISNMIDEVTTSASLDDFRTENPDEDIQDIFINPNSRGELTEIEQNLLSVFNNLLNTSAAPAAPAAITGTTTAVTTSTTTENKQSKQDKMLLERWKKIAGIL